MPLHSLLQLVNLHHPLPLLKWTGYACLKMAMRQFSRKMGKSDVLSISCRWALIRSRLLHTASLPDQGSTYEDVELCYRMEKPGYSSYGIVDVALITLNVVQPQGCPN